MAKALDVCNAACRRIGVLAFGDTLETDQVTDALFALNTILDNWRLENLELYISDVEAADELILEHGYQDALIYALALKIAPEYGIQIDAVTQQEAINTKRAIVKAAVSPIRTRGDVTLQGLSRRRYHHWNDLCQK